MRRNYSQPSGSASYQRRYAGFRGVDFTSSPLYVDPTRSPYAENIIVDSAGVVHKRPGYTMFRHIASPPNTEIHNITFYKPPVAVKPDSIMVTHEKAAMVIDGEMSVGLDWNDAPSQAFQFGGKLYVLDGKHYRVLYYDDKAEDYTRMQCKEVYEIATPTETQIAGYYLAEEKTEMVNDQSQTTFEYTWTFGEQGERNLLTGRRINTFCGDGIHDTFYFDCANFKVYKVEIFRVIPNQNATTTEATVTIKTGSNIRKSPSMNGDIIANTGSSTPTCVTQGKSGKWYQILWGEQTAYVHQDRVSSTSGTVASMTTDEKGWETLTSGYTISEVSSSGEHPAGNTAVTVKSCTKIVFGSAPPVHPRGNGLPNIRITGAATEIATASRTFTQDNIDYGETELEIPESSMMTALISVAKNGTTLSSDAYSVTYAGDHGARVTVTTLTAGDEVVVTYRRETFRDFGTIEKCTTYGQYGEYNHDRFFFTGNPDHLNRDWYTEPSDPTVVLENSYTDIGDQHTGIAGYLNFQSDMLIIKLDSNGDNLFRRTASTDGDLTIFPVRAYKGRGVTNAKAMANIKGECVFLTPEGVYEFISSDLGSKYGIKEMSYTVRKKLLNEDLTKAEMGVWGDWLLVTFSDTGHCYVADTSQQTAPSSSGGNGWEWFYWTSCPWQNMAYNNEDETLYFSTAGGRLNYIERDHNYYADLPWGYFDESHTYGEGEVIPVPVPYTALWTTPLDEMDEPARYKYLARRGAMLQFDQAVSQMLEVAVVMDGETMLLYRDEDMLRDYLNHSDYTLVNLKAATGVPYFTLNTPSGRWKYLQFIFRNSDPETDGIALMCLEFQYRFGRYII